MKRRPTALLAFAAAVLGMCGASLVNAQATRTWVSGVGDDVNPCSRTAPCKTWAGAISKTAAGGEINALDPGGFGALTITKSISVIGSVGPGTAGTLHSAGAGFVINAGLNDTVTVRGLTINGVGLGADGIRIIQAGAVFIENVEIFNENGRGISDQRIAGGQLFVDGATIRDNAQTGIVIIPSSGSTPIEASIRNVRLVGNQNSGIAIGAGARVTISNSVISGNVNYGVYVEQPAGTTRAFLSDTSISGNQTGIIVGPGAPAVRLSNMLVTNNSVGINTGFATITSYGNNKIGGNTSGNGPFSPPLDVVGLQ
jgi:hypothetical protein